MLTAGQIANAGGLAFPHDEKDGGGDHWQSHSGMTLRDYFAAQALISMGPWSSDPGFSLATTQGREARALWAYAQADAMLKERGR